MNFIKKFKQRQSYEIVIAETIRVLGISREEAHKRMMNLLDTDIMKDGVEDETTKFNMDAYMQIPSRLSWIYPILKKEERKEVYDENEMFDCFLIEKRVHRDELYRLMKMFYWVTKLGGNGAFLWLTKDKKIPGDEKSKLHIQIFKNSLLYMEKLIQEKQ